MKIILQKVRYTIVSKDHDLRFVLMNLYVMNYVFSSV